MAMVGILKDKRSCDLDSIESNLTIERPGKTLFCSTVSLTMKYLALLSGGKDSCYNLVHCAQNGHELVAAASLGPEPGKGPAYTQSRLLTKFTAL